MEANAVEANAIESHTTESNTIEPNAAGESSGNGSLAPAASASPSTTSLPMPPARPPSVLARHSYPRQCVACLDTFPIHHTAHGPCRHNYCRPCMQELFQNALDDRTLFPPRCCHRRIGVRHVWRFLPKNLLVRFAARQREYDTPNRTYCHRCSVFVPPRIQNGNDEAAIATRAVCPSCQVATCTTCKNEFHSGACPEDEQTVQFRSLAQQMGWRACPSCNTMVERNGGCSHITCLCGHEFCYNCRRPYRTCSCHPLVHPLVLRRMMRDQEIEIQNRLMEPVEVARRFLSVRPADS
jgi:hypothetical protein